MDNDAEWTQGGESGTAQPQGWREGTPESLAKYLAVVTKHGVGSTQERRAANVAMISGGWGPRALGQALGQHQSGGKGHHGGNLSGGRRSTDRSNTGNGERFQVDHPVDE